MISEEKFSNENMVREISNFESVMIKFCMTHYEDIKSQCAARIQLHNYIIDYGKAQRKIGFKAARNGYKQWNVNELDGGWSSEEKFSDVKHLEDYLKGGKKL